MHHLSERVRKHEASKMHIDSCMKLSAFGKDGIATQLDERYRQTVRRHNDEVGKNRRVLGRLIDYIKSCGALALAMRLQSTEDSEVSSSPGTFGPVDIAAALDDLFDEQLRMVAALKDKSKTMQNELLECMASVIRERVVEEVKNGSIRGSPSRRNHGRLCRGSAGACVEIHRRQRCCARTAL